MNSENINEFTSSKVALATWIDIKTLAEIKRITPRAVRMSISKGNYITRAIKTQGGKTYEILLSSLPDKERALYRDKYYKQIVEAALDLEPIANPKEVNLEKVLKNETFIPDKARKIALLRLDLITEWQKFRKEQKSKTKADKEFLDLYNSGEYIKNIFSHIGKTSRGSLQR